MLQQFFVKIKILMFIINNQAAMKFCIDLKYIKIKNFKKNKGNYL